jgi:hypothetical protein
VPTATATAVVTPLTFNFTVTLSCTYDASRTPTVTCVTQ